MTTPQYIPRYYQADAIARGTAFMLDERKKSRNGVIYIPTGGGKALVAGGLAVELSKTAPVMVFQPGKEILEQNLEKIESYGFQAEVFSASMGERNIGEVTLATIGSVYRHPEYFEDFQFGLIDEGHLVGLRDNSRTVIAGEDQQFVHRELGLVTATLNQDGVKKSKVRVIDDDGVIEIIDRPKKSMYRSFFDMLPHMRWLCLTASPYRLQSDAMGSQLKVITRTRPAFWHEFVHYTQNRELFDAGFLAKLEYYPVTGFKRSKVALNSTGADYDPKTLQMHLWEKHWETKNKKSVHLPDKLTEIVNRVLDAGRRNVLVFTSSIRESEYLAEQMKGECAIVTGETPKGEREELLRDFKSGAIKVISNVNCLSHGFDFPALECVIDTAPTMSLTRYYQRIGRIVRRDPENDAKVGWSIDMAGGYEQFGRVEDLTLYCQGNSRWDVFGRPGGPVQPQKQLTTTYLGGNALKGCCPKCHAPKTVMYYTAKKKWLPVSRPPAGSRATLIVEQVDGKSHCRMVKRDDPEAHKATMCFHFAVCSIYEKRRKDSSG